MHHIPTAWQLPWQAAEERAGRPWLPTVCLGRRNQLIADADLLHDVKLLLLPRHILLRSRRLATVPALVRRRVLLLRVAAVLTFCQTESVCSGPCRKEVLKYHCVEPKQILFKAKW